MTLTEYQQRIRSKHLTASRMPAVVGADPRRGAVDLWLEYTGRVPPNTETSEAAELGLDAEPMLIDWCAKRIGVRTRANQLRVHKDGILSATHDALVVGRPEAIQCKTTGLTGPVPERDQWGEEGTDEVPIRVIVQCAAEMVVSDLDRVYVPVWIGNVGRRLYVIDRNENLCAKVVEYGDWFWRHVASDTRPTGVPSIETLKRIVRQPGASVEIDPSLVADWLAAQAIRRDAEKVEERCKAALIDALGDAENGVSELGTVTYRETVRKGHVVAESRYRTPRFVKNKESRNVGAIEGDRAVAAAEGSGGVDRPRLDAVGP